MALFRRRPSGGQDGQVAAFWEWWSREGRAAAGRSIAGELAPEEFAADMTRQVRALGDLGWELAAGESSEHVLVITAEGDPAGRALARRMVLGAPDADEAWSYVDVRPPAPDPEAVVLNVDGSPDIDFARVLVGARLDGRRFDVTVHHPSFADLPDRARVNVAFLALDAALGEVDTELWLGEITPAQAPPLDGFGLTALRSVVQDLKRQHLDQDGNPNWVLLSGEASEGRLVAAAQSPLHPLTAPHLDTHVAVVLPYEDRTDEGLPGPGSLDALRAFEDRLGAAVGNQGAVVAHQSVAGVRTLHVYVDSTTDALPAVKHTARSWEQGKASVHDMRDPGWDAVQHLRG